MKDLGALMKQAQAMQQKLQEAQAKLAETLVERCRLYADSADQQLPRL